MCDRKLTEDFLAVDSPPAEQSLHRFGHVFVERDNWLLKDVLDFNCESLGKGLGASKQKDLRYKGVEVRKENVDLWHA